MTDVTFTRSGPLRGQRAGKKPRGVSVRRVTNAAGEKVTVRALNANSDTFGEDFLYIFTRNVEAARRENKRLFGSPDGAPADD